MEKASRPERKRKVDLGESEPIKSSVELKTRRLDVVMPENSGNSTCESVDSASCCSSNGASELVKGSSKSVNLEETDVTVELIAIAAGESVDSRDSNGTTPSSAVHVQTGEQESTARSRELISRCRSTRTEKPPEAEIEGFFAAIEKNLQKKFIDKYNYDIVKDEPLMEGRYEWVQIEQKP